MAYSDAFSEWWLVYPKKVGKRAAQKSWLVAVREIAAERGIGRAAAIAWLLGRTQMFAGSDLGENKKFRPDPERWLNRGRFDDDPDEWYTRGVPGSQNKGDVDQWRP